MLKSGKMEPSVNQQSQKQGFFHMMEQRRSAAENECWKQMVGPGSAKKHKQLLQFLKQGGLTQSQVEQKAKFAQGWNSTKDVEWVSWKKVCEEYGEEEAKLRVANHLILTRRCPKAKKRALRSGSFQKKQIQSRLATEPSSHRCQGHK